ncbi:transketolase [Allostella sp. ATCC 35155]|nr:transketolase [Stella sp. ATCC 35155]
MTAAPTPDAPERDLEVRDFNARGATASAARRIYGEALLEAARLDPRIVCLTADLTLPTETDLFRDELPDRFLQVGIAEANMIGVAGGMAKAGEIPFVHSFCVFATRRCYDQIANQVAYPNANLKIVGVIPGLTTLLGVSHQAIDDVALMRALPNMTVIEPSGPAQIRAAVFATARHPGPVYLRLKRSDGTEPPDLAEEPLERGRLRRLRPGGDGLLVASGLMVAAALDAADRLATEGLAVGVVEMATIKPLDPDLAELAAAVPALVTAENHSIIGGLGSAVAEMLMEAGVRCGFERIGVRDVFAEGGTTPYLLQKYGLTAEAIVAAFHRARGKTLR